MIERRFAAALALHEAGRRAEATAAYRDILAAHPDHPDTLHLLGLLGVEQGDPAGGLPLIERAIARNARQATFHNSLGQAYHALGRLVEAAEAFRTAAGLLPGRAEIHNNLATVLLALERRPEAIRHYRRAAAAAPEVADVWFNLANALVQVEAPAEAEDCFRRALALKPDFSAALANYGRFLMQHRRPAEAEPLLRRTVALTPNQPEAWNNLGILLQDSDNAAAADCFRQAVALQPGLAVAHYNLGCLLSGQGQTTAALASLHAALAADAGFGKARIAACMAHLPILYDSEQEVIQRRRDYAAALRALADAAPDPSAVPAGRDPTDRKPPAATVRAPTPAPIPALTPAPAPASLAEAIGSWQPFFLPYQGGDDRVLQSLYGRFACNALARAARPAAPATWRGGRIRLGIVSGFFREHTVFKLFLQGWLSRIDRDRFEVVGFHTGPTSDACTDWCAGRCDRFVQGLASPAAWRDAVAAAQPHALLYPEVGMDPVAGHLAAARLAAVQCVSWGQPVTTGLPTMDYFLSAALMEPPDADAAYTERLVRLPALGICYQPDEPSPRRLDRAALGLDPEVPVFWSGQALYKYLPRHDRLFPRIAAELGRCQFVFVAFAKSRAVTRAFRARLHRAFAAAGLDADAHVVVLPALSQADYLDAVALADVVLDTPEWSGGKSTLDCLAVDPAIVTMPGRFMRGRHTTAILRRIGCEATVVDSLDGYVAAAVRLARDGGCRAAVRARVARNKHLAYDDAASVRALEAFLDAAVRRAAAATDQPAAPDCASRGRSAVPDPSAAGWLSEGGDPS